MSILDIILLICFIPALVQGLKKGFISQVIAIVSIVVGVSVSLKFANIAGAWLAQHIDASGEILKITAFALILIGVFIVLGLLGKLLEKILDFVFLGWVNKLLGTVFSLMKGILILGLIALIINSFYTSTQSALPETFQTSTLYPVISDIAEGIFPYIKNLLTLK